MDAQGDSEFHDERQEGRSVRTIWKFPLNWNVQQSVNFPRGATILDVQMQGSTICLWAVVNTESPIEPRIIHVVGTGCEVPPQLYKEHYIGTVQVDGYVWHLFQESL